MEERINEYIPVISAADDVPQADEIRALIKDIWDLRTAKLRRSIDQMVAQQATYGKVLRNLTSCDHHVTIG